MSLPSLLARHARAIVIVAFALALAGLASSFTLPVGLFPQVSFPRVVVDLDAGDRPADQTALLLTRPVEEAIRTVPGVAGLRSAPRAVSPPRSPESVTMADLVRPA